MSFTMGRLVLGLSLFMLAGCEVGFTSEDITNCESEIRSELSRHQGITVIDVTMMKESSKKLRGFAKLLVNDNGEMIEVLSSCEASWMEGDQYLWECE